MMLTNIPREINLFNPGPHKKPDREPIILHSDLNCFYASVEMMLHPELKGKAVAVCGSTAERHGIVLAKSYEAKARGIKTGMVRWEAERLCPNIIFVPPDYDQYIKYSHLVQEIYRRFTDQIEPFGMDECWLDVTNSTGIYRDGKAMAELISSIIERELGLTVSIGVSFNKVFAKLGSDMKKPRGLTVISRENFQNVVWPLPVGKLIYAGPATVYKLAQRGILTIGQLATLPVEMVQDWLGRNGAALWSYAKGQDISRVKYRGYVSPVKSIGHGITCIADLDNEAEAWKVMLELAQDIGHRLRGYGVLAGGVQLMVRDKALNFHQYQASFSLAHRSPYLLARAAKKLLQERYNWKQPLRAISIRAIKLIPQDRVQAPDLFADVEALIHRDHVDNTVETVRERFGKEALKAAVLLEDLHMPVDGREKVRMPSLMFK
jgi:DNA polymerase-4